jgi:hypothetical protein
MDFEDKYLKYKTKYLFLKDNLNGGTLKLDESDCQLTLITQEEIDLLLNQKFNLYSELNLLFNNFDNESEKQMAREKLNSIDNINQIFKIYKEVKDHVFNKANFLLRKINNTEITTVKDGTEEKYKLPEGYIINKTSTINDINTWAKQIRIPLAKYENDLNIKTISEASLSTLDGQPTDSQNVNELSVDLSTKISLQVKTNIDLETFHYKQLILQSMQNIECKWFLKGGFVHGFKLVQLLSESNITTTDKINIIKDTNKYIRDFDLTMCIPGNKTQYDLSFERFNQIQILKDFFRCEGQVVLVYRYIDRYLTKNNESFIEFSVKNCITPHDKDHLIDLEIPITAMTIQINEHNIDTIIEIMKIYLIINEISKDFESITESTVNDLVGKINELTINTSDITNLGLFDVLRCNFGSNENGNKLSDKMIDLIRLTANNPLLSTEENKESIMQLLASHISEPDRLFIRLFGKNIVKSNESKILLLKYGYNEKQLRNVKWILNIEKITLIINLFFNEIKRIYINFDDKKQVDFQNKKVRDMVKNIFDIKETEYFANVNLARLDEAFRKIIQKNSLKSKITIYDMLKIIFSTSVEVKQHLLKMKIDNKLFNLQKSFYNLEDSITHEKIKLIKQN